MLWGTTGTAQTFMSQTIHPMVVGATRLAVGGFFLLAILLIMKKIDFRGWPWQATLFSAAAMAAFQPLFFSSVRLTGIAIGTVVAIGSAPVFSGLVEWLFLKMRPTRVWIAATVLAILGCALLFITRDGVAVHPLGVVMSLGAGLMFAVYALISKNVLKKVDTVPAVAVIFSISALMLLPFLFIFETEGLVTGNGIAVVLYLGIAATSIAYILFSAGLKQIPSSSAVTLSLAEPLTAAVLSVAVVGEQLNATSWAGVAMLLGGILVLTLSGRKLKADG